MADSITALQGDCREELQKLADKSVHCVITSPPYYQLRNYRVKGQIGLEQSPDAYVQELVKVFREVHRVLRDDGTLWLNLGDSYRAKQLLGIPWRVALSLQAGGWYLRSDIIWSKTNVMPESVMDRPTKAHEYIFLLSKYKNYYYDSDSIREPNLYPPERGGKKQGYASGVKGCGSLGQPNMRQSRRERFNPAGRNKRTVWNVPTRPFAGTHFATFPPALIRPCVLAGCPVGGVVLDLFAGSGTTGNVAAGLERKAILIELNPEYLKL